MDFLKKALAKAHEAAQERPLEVQIKACRDFIGRSEQRLARLEADQQAETALLTEGRSTMSLLESQQSEAPGVTELEQRITAATRIRKNQSGAQTVVFCWTTFHQCPTTCKRSKVGRVAAIAS